MSAKNAPDRGPSIGPAAAIHKIDPEDYPDAVTAIQAALEDVVHYDCRDCGHRRYEGPKRPCKVCGGTAFNRTAPDGGGHVE